MLLDKVSKQIVEIQVVLLLDVGLVGLRQGVRNDDVEVGFLVLTEAVATTDTLHEVVRRREPDSHALEGNVSTSLQDRPATDGELLASSTLAVACVNLAQLLGSVLVRILGMDAHFARLGVAVLLRIVNHVEQTDLVVGAFRHFVHDMYVVNLVMLRLEMLVLAREDGYSVLVETVLLLNLDWGSRKEHLR